MQEGALRLSEHCGEGVEESEGKGTKRRLLGKGLRPQELEDHGRETSADAKAASAFPEEFQKLSEEKSCLPEQVFNCGKTGLFQKKTPNHTCICESAKQALGFKAPKVRLTVVLGGHAAGHGIKPHLGVNNSWALRDKTTSGLPMFWQHEKAWVMAISFWEGLHQCFTPEVKKYLRGKGLPLQVLLTTGNAPSHPQLLCLSDRKVEAPFLPPPAPSLLQPLRPGIREYVNAACTCFAFRDVVAALVLTLTAARRLCGRALQSQWPHAYR